LHLSNLLSSGHLIANDNTFDEAGKLQPLEFFGAVAYNRECPLNQPGSDLRSFTIEEKRTSMRASGASGPHRVVCRS
jgi:hypothetical protein